MRNVSVYGAHTFSKPRSQFWWRQIRDELLATTATSVPQIGIRLLAV